MSKYCLPILLALFVLDAKAVTSNLNSSGIAIEGFDPVSYFRPEALKQGPIKGQTQFQLKQGDETYLFSSEANKNEFLKNPGKYTPAFGGWCAYAVAEKKQKVEVDIKSFLIQDGRLLLFYNGFLANTREKWLSTKSKSSVQFLKEADANWPEVKNKEP